MNGVCGMGERNAERHGAAKTRARKTFKTELLGFLCQLQIALRLVGDATIEIAGLEYGFEGNCVMVLLLSC